MPIDYKLYPPNWKTEIVPAVLARAENKCECCGVENKSMQWRGVKQIIKILPPQKGRKSERKLKVNRTFPYPSREAAEADGCIEKKEWQWTTVDGKLTRVVKKVHGIYQVKVVLTVAHLDHDETNWEVKLDRLQAMCQLCHLQYDAKEKFRRAMTPGYYTNRLNQPGDTGT